jgi:serine/threonine-protein kinase HipA
VADELAVWMYGKNVATIVRERGRPRLAYTQEALDNFQLGTPLLSLSLPLTNRQYPQGTVRPFLDGLLPEGEARKSIARDVGVGETDTFGLIRELGRDCAGAIVIQPMDEAAPIRPTILTAEKLEPEELETLVRELKSAHLTRWCSRKAGPNAHARRLMGTTR